MITVLLYHFGADSWTRDLPPALSPPSLLGLIVIGLASFTSARLAERRDPESDSTRRMPEAWGVVASLALMMWSSREAGHLAQLINAQGGGGGGGLSWQTRTAAAAITSGAWLLQATALLIMGWTRRSPFLRWCGLVLFGLTAFKFALVDLQSVDVFWRFATAIALGAAMLAISYYYRRRSIPPRESESGPGELERRTGSDG